jgi:hypothetical protein
MIGLRDMMRRIRRQPDLERHREIRREMQQLTKQLREGDFLSAMVRGEHTGERKTNHEQTSQNR